MKIQLFLYCLLFFSSRMLFSFNIELLKGTHTILPDTSCAPFRSLIFLEEDIAKQWHLLSATSQVAEAKATLQELGSVNQF